MQDSWRRCPVCWEDSRNETVISDQSVWFFRNKKVIVTSEDYPVYVKKVEDSVLKHIAEVSLEDHPVIIKDPVRKQNKVLSFIEPVIKERRKCPWICHV